MGKQSKLTALLSNKLTALLSLQLTAFSRLKLGSILPMEHRVIVMDSDMIVQGKHLTFSSHPPSVALPLLGDTSLYIITGVTLRL